MPIDRRTKWLGRLEITGGPPLESFEMVGVTSDDEAFAFLQKWVTVLMEKPEDLTSYRRGQMVFRVYRSELTGKVGARLAKHVRTLDAKDVREWAPAGTIDALQGKP